MHEDVRYCPHCDDPYIKDAHCDHVKCLSCAKEFCYFCMVAYGPIYAHGASRHRIGCRNWAPNANDDNPCPNCVVDCRPPEETLE